MVQRKVAAVAALNQASLFAGQAAGKAERQAAKYGRREAVRERGRAEWEARKAVPQEP